MDSKRKVYIILIAVAAAVLLGLIIWAICLTVNNSADSTDPTGGQTESTAQSTENTSGETTDTTAEVTTQPEDTTAEATDAAETTKTDETKPSGNSNSGGQSNSGDNSDPDDDNEPDDEPDNKPDNDPTEPAPTEPSYPYNVTWKEYDEMSEDEQIAFYKCFKNHNDFKQWRTAAKAAYDETKIQIEIGEDGKIDLGQITGKN